MAASMLPILGGMFSSAAIMDETRESVAAWERERVAQLKNAEIAREAGAYNASRQQEQAQKVFGSMAADVAASGTTQDSGSVLDILRESQSNAELDRLSILHSAELEAIDAENAAASAGASSRSNSKMGQSRALSAMMGGAAQGAANMPSNSSSGGSSRPSYSRTDTRYGQGD